MAMTSIISGQIGSELPKGCRINRCCNPIRAIVTARRRNIGKFRMGYLIFQLYLQVLRQFFS
jgi:hypothetical protein